MMAALVGVITGTAVTVFKTLIGAVKEFSYSGDLLGRFPPGGAASTYVGAFIPVLGALGVVSMMWLLQLKSYGPGLGGLTEEVDRQVPWSPRRTLGKTLAAVATLGTGNSLGPEGPAVELGVASSRYVSAMSNLSVQRQRMLLGAGAAAGVAAGFNAPIAGIFFALEIVKDTFNTNYNSKSFIAATLLCAVVSALMAKIGLHDELSLRPAAYNLESPLIELPLYLGLGVVAGLVAVMFKYFSRKSSDVFKGNFPGFGWMKGVPQWSKPIMMAAVTGAVGVFFPQVLFFGYDTLDKLLANTGSYSLPLLCFLCVAKAMLTAGALGSGLVGGTFAPSLFLGATAGAAYQRILQGLLTAFRTTAGPSLATLSTFLLPISSRMGIGGPAGDLSSLLTIAGSPAYAMVGAAAVLSALYRAPLTGSLLLFELTKDYDIVLPLMAAAGVSSLVVELFSRADAPVVQARLEAAAGMPRDMSLEIGLKISGKVDKLMGKIQVTDALVPRILTLTADTSLSEAMRAFRLTRNEFAVVVARSGYESFEASPSSSSTPEGAGGRAGTNGDATGWHAQTVLAEDMWERRDMKLVGVLALREINLALDRERANFYGDDDGRPELTAGSVCRQNCFTVKTSTDIASAKRLMNLKAVRYLPVVVDLPPSPSAGTSTAAPATNAAAAAVAAAAAPRPPSRPPGAAAASAIASPFTRKRSSNTNKDGGDSSTRNSSQQGGAASAELPPPPLPPPPPPPQAVVGVLSRESLRIAGRLTETERAIRDRPKASPPPASPLPLSPLSPPPSPDAEGER
ncbi:unnamed protein product [Scytosiphon promiscuus]